MSCHYYSRWRKITVFPYSFRQFILLIKSLYFHLPACFTCQPIFFTQTMTFKAIPTASICRFSILDQEGDFFCFLSSLKAVASQGEGKRERKSSFIQKCFTNISKFTWTFFNTSHNWENLWASGNDGNDIMALLKINEAFCCWYRSWPSALSLWHLLHYLGSAFGGNEYPFRISNQTTML